VILVAGKHGQLANRLFQFAHVLAFAVERGVRVANPGFGDYADEFPAFAGDALCRWPPPRVALPPRWRDPAFANSERLVAVLRRAGRPLGAVALVEAGDAQVRLGDQALARLARRPLLVVAGWQLRDEVAVERHAGLVRRVFEPRPERRARAAAAAAAARGDADLLVGLHVRRGDYVRFDGGRFFYSPEQYARIVERVRAAAAPRRVAILACSDELEAIEALGPGVAAGPGHLVEDLYALAECDAVVGPPSTFSAWAGFHGRAAVHHVEDPEAEIPAAKLGL
jgi:hypothetical protein